MSDAPLDLVRFGDGPLELEVLPGVGARLHRLRAYGHDLLRTPDDAATHLADPFFWGGYPMAPWGGRVEPGPIVVAGRTVDLKANFLDGTAIHGQVYARPWRATGPSSFAVSGRGDGWPWEYEVRLDVAVVAERATLTYELVNRSETQMPAGIGVHPWFVGIDDAVIRAARVYHDNLATTPQPEPVAGPFDRRAGGPMPIGLDATWAELDDPPVSLAWRGPEVGLDLRAQAPELVIVAASPTEPAAVAIEPQTHAPQGLRRLLRDEPAPLALLDPGAILRLRVELEVRLRG